MESGEYMDSIASNANHAANSTGTSRLQQINYVNADHLRNCFVAMNEMRKSGQLCDVSLEVNSNKVKAHRLVLSATSAYFNAMFNSEMAEKSKSVIVLHDIDFNALNLLVEYSYTGEISICEDNVQSLLPAASLLQISSVREACCKFLLRQLHPSNCLGIRHFADAHSCEELHQTSHKYALENFPEVVLTEEFLDLPYNEVENLISSDQLNVTTEECVYNAVMSWIKHDLKNREHYLGSILQHVRLPLTTRSFLLNKVSEEPLIQ
ncbi:Kelch-like protein 17, partial [Dinothrombium tinctorium]